MNIYQLGRRETVYRGVRPDALIVIANGEMEIGSPSLYLCPGGWAFFTDSFLRAEKYSVFGRVIVATIPACATILDLMNVPEEVYGRDLDAILPGLAAAVGFKGSHDGCYRDELWRVPDDNMAPLVEFVRKHGIDAILWSEADVAVYVVVNPTILEDVQMDVWCLVGKENCHA